MIQQQISTLNPSVVWKDGASDLFEVSICVAKKGTDLNRLHWKMAQSYGVEALAINTLEISATSIHQPTKWLT